MKRINELFKPSKITWTGKSKILLTENGKFVVKPKNKCIKSLHDYLLVRGFSNYSKVVDEFDDNYVYEHLEEINVPINQKASDMAGLLANLHNKTSYYKTVTSDYYKSIYEIVQGNLSYIEDYYSKEFDRISREVIMSPSDYLIIRNASKLNEVFEFTKKELETWFNKVSSNTKERVVYCHNNLSIDHYIKNLDDYFISWDNYAIDTPVLDLINLYKSDYDRYDFSNFFEIYNYSFPLTEEEKKLFYIVIALPYELRLKSDEFNNTKMTNELFVYLYKTENLIRSYYSPHNKE